MGVKLLALINACLDRLVVIAGALIGAQVPGFISHYRQRLGGQMDVVSSNMTDWQRIAQSSYAGDLDQLIQAYRSSQTPSIVATSEKIRMDRDRLQTLEQSAEALDTADAWMLLPRFVQHYDHALAVQTWQDYIPNLPTTLTALAYAALGAVLAGVLYQLISTLLRKIFVPDSDSERYWR